MDNKHIILMGFKNVGKSTIGAILAEKLQRPFIDIDKKIEANYLHETNQALTCREIFKKQGELFFREQETQALRQAISAPSAVIALGGGAVMREENQALIKPHYLVHITGEPEVVYARIMTQGKPAYFPENEDPLQFFQRLWTQHQAIYDNLAQITVDNSASSLDAASLTMERIKCQKF